MNKIIAGVLLIIGFSSAVQATSDSWKTDASGSWNIATNWTGGNIPGSTVLSNSADVATFSTLLTSGRTVTVDANRNIGGITFGNTSTNLYTLSGGSLLLSNGGIIQTIAGTGSHNDTVASAVTIMGDGGSATIRNDSVGNTAGLVISGVISGNSTAGNTTTITFDGVAEAVSISGKNSASGVISDGVNGGKVAVVKNGTGIWTFGVNSTYSGGLTFNAGTIRYFGGGDHGFGTGTVTINGDVVFYRGNSTANTMTNYLLLNGNFEVKANTGGTWGGPINLNGGTRTITTTSSFGITGGISNGGLIKAGGSILTLSNANTHALGTTVSAGTLIAGADMALGSGDVTVASGATLTLTGGTSHDYIHDKKALILNATSTLNLDFTGEDKVRSISLDGGATKLSAGTYTAAQLSTLGSGTYTGTGSLTVGLRSIRLIRLTAP